MNIRPHATDASTLTSGIITSSRSRTPSSNPSNSHERTHELELVNEIVEQALVDNLLDGEYYSTNDIELIQNHHQSHAQRTVAAAAVVVESPASTSAISNGNPNSGTTDSTDESSDVKSLNEEQANLMTSSLSANENLINILIRFVNEKEMRIQARPNDTILILKKYGHIFF